MRKKRREGRLWFLEEMWKRSGSVVYVRTCGGDSQIGVVAWRRTLAGVENIGNG